jgi:hypothetical protein
MDMKKIVSIVIGLVLMLTVVGCQNGKKAAENDVKDSMQALQKGDFSKLNYDKESIEALETFGGAYKKITYKINKTTEESKDKVLVNITMKYPDLSEAGKIFKDKIIKVAEQLAGKSDAEVEEKSKQFLREAINEKLNDPNLKYLEETFDMVYVKQDGNWELENNNPQFNKVMSFNYQM